MEESDRITEGKYVILQRGDQQRVILFSSQEMIAYGKGPSQQDIQLKNALNEEYYTAFKVMPCAADEGSAGVKQGKGGRPVKKIFYLEKSTDAAAKSFTQVFELPSTVQSAKDNRNIFDDKTIQIQSVNQSDIFTMREQGVSSKDILDTIISSSKSFTQKTEYSQEKYLKKKEKVHGDVLLFLKPDLHIIADFYFKKDAARIQGLRPDTLSQILSYSNVHANGKFLIYENLCGLVVAAILQRLGGIGTLLHCHAGSNPQRQALNYMNLSSETLAPLRNLDVFHMIQRKTDVTSSNGNVETISTTDKISTEIEEEPLSKRIKTDLEVDEEVPIKMEEDDDDTNNGKPLGDDNPPVVNKLVSSTTRIENEKSLELLNTTEFDGLVISGKEHPLTILQKLLPHLAPSCPFVVYCLSPEPLMECYWWIKERNCGVNMHILDNWFRSIQVDTERTHPEINMSSSGGYILHGIFVKDNQ